MFEHLYPQPGQQPLFPPDPVDALIERLAAEALAEAHALRLRAEEEIQRRLAFHRRSAAQRRRFARYRALHGSQ